MDLNIWPCMYIPYQTLSGLRGCLWLVAVAQILNNLKRSGQGRIYVANEHPTYARNVSNVDQKLKILGPIVLNRRQISLF